MKMKIYFNSSIWFALLIIITITSLMIRYGFMTQKFFLDSIGMLYLERSELFSDDSFGIAAQFFYYINFLDIATLFEWSCYIAIIYFFINLWMLKDIKVMTLNKFIFLLLSIFLLYLFAVGITKEVLQGGFYLLIYFLCIKNKSINGKFLKVLLGSGILVINALVFREYYLLVAFFTVIIFFIFELIKNRYYTKERKILAIVFLVIAIVFCFMATVRIYLPVEYELIVNLRSHFYSALAETTDSFIKDIIENDSSDLYVYVLNYCLNFMRLLCPVEILLIGKFHYIPFLIYQLWFTRLYVEKLSSLNKLNTEKYLSLIFITSFLVVAAMMEPDFGSWARHQTVCFCFVYELFIKKDN